MRDIFKSQRFKSLFSKIQFDENVLLSNAEKSRATLISQYAERDRITDSIFSLDQQIFSLRRQKGWDQLPDSLDAINDSNSKVLLNLFDQYGFPSLQTSVPELYNDTLFYEKNGYLVIIYSLSTDD